MNITHGDFSIAVGDSITEGSLNEGGYGWPEPPGGLWATVNATWPQPPSPVKVLSSSTGAKATSTGARASVAPSVVTGKQVIFEKSGLVGATAVFAAANLQTLVYDKVPPGLASPLFVLLFGINDALQIFLGLETIGDFGTAYGSIQSGILGRWPGARIVCGSCACSGELWLPGPPAWDPSNPWTTQIDAIDTEIQTLVTALANPNVIYWDIRTPLLAWEVTHNPQPPASGGIGFIANGFDGAAVHPKIVAMLEVLAPAFLALVPVVP